MKNIIVETYERHNKHVVTVYLTWTENGKQQKEATNISWKKTAPLSEIKQSQGIAEVLRSAKQTEINFGAAGLYNKARLNIDFMEFANDYSDGIDSVSERTKCNQMLKRLAMHAGNNIPCFMVNEAFCKSFRTYLKNNLAGDTAQGYFRLFKQLIKQAKRDKLLKENFAEDLPSIPIGSPMVEKDKLDPDELQQLFATPFRDTELVRAVRLAAVTGMGDAEIRHLIAKQVNPKTMEITYRRQKNKNKKVKSVTVPITEETLQLLGDLSQPGRLLFNLYNRRHVNRLLAKWVAAAEINKHITFYCLRHSCIQNLLDMGVEDSTITDIVGHKDSRMLARYGRRSSEQKRNAINTISK